MLMFGFFVLVKNMSSWFDSHEHQLVSKTFLTSFSFLNRQRGQKAQSCTTEFWFLFYLGIRSDMLKNGPGYQDKLIQWLAEEGFGHKYWVPCFRGSVDGWNASLFQKECASKKSTVIIIRKGDCLFGGFTDKPWEGKVVLTQLKRD